MYPTATQTYTFTRTDAQYLASRIAADLRQVQILYGRGRPTDQEIQNYAVEAGMLLHFKLLDRVTYGFKRDGVWALSLEYSTNYLGNLQVDGPPGSVPAGANIAGTSWGSFLNRKVASHLTQPQVEAIDEAIPISRNSGEEPRYSGGQFADPLSYARHGVELQRKIYWSTT